MYDQSSDALFSPDGGRVLTCGSSGMRGWDSTDTALWDAATGERVLTITRCEDAATGAFSPDGDLVAVGCRRRGDNGGDHDGDTVVWKVGPG